MTNKSKKKLVDIVEVGPESTEWNKTKNKENERLKVVLLWWNWCIANNTECIFNMMVRCRCQRVANSSIQVINLCQHQLTAFKQPFLSF